MSRITTIITGSDGKVTTIVTRRSGCGCGAFFTLLLIVFVIAAPAHYASQGDWPLGWAGAVLAYVVAVVLLVGGIIAAGNARSRRKSP